MVTTLELINTLRAIVEDNEIVGHLVNAAEGNVKANEAWKKISRGQRVVDEATRRFATTDWGK